MVDEWAQTGIVTLLMPDSSPLRIVHVITRLIVGGAQENTLLSCEGQHDAGHEVTLLTGPTEGPEGSLMERATSHGYRVEVIEPMRRSVLPRKDWATYHALRQAFKRLNPDVVHTHSSKAGILGRLAAWDSGVPHVVHTIHGLSFTASRRRVVNHLYVQLERFAAKRCHTIVCVADAMARESLAVGIGTPEQYVTVYSGMDTSAFLDPPKPRDKVRRELDLAPDDVAVVTIARLFHRKGHEDLLNHASRLCRAHPHLRFLWVGDGILRGIFEAQIAQQGLQKRFLLTGLVAPERVSEFVAAADVLAHPSRREGLARALPQGQLAGLPVVTYDIDGNAEGLLDGETGYAVPAFDIEQFIDRIDQLVADADLRQRMGEAGRTFAKARFDTKVMVDQLEQIYRRRGTPALSA